MIRFAVYAIRYRTVRWALTVAVVLVAVGIFTVLGG